MGRSNRGGTYGKHNRELLDLLKGGNPGDIIRKVGTKNEHLIVEWTKLLASMGMPGIGFKLESCHLSTADLINLGLLPQNGKCPYDIDPDPDAKKNKKYQYLYTIIGNDFGGTNDMDFLLPNRNNELSGIRNIDKYICDITLEKDVWSEPVDLSEYTGKKAVDVKIKLKLIENDETEIAINPAGDETEVGLATQTFFGAGSSGACLTTNGIAIYECRTDENGQVILKIYKKGPCKVSVTLMSVYSSSDGAKGLNKTSKDNPMYVITYRDFNPAPDNGGAVNTVGGKGPISGDVTLLEHPQILTMIEKYSSQMIDGNDEIVFEKEIKRKTWCDCNLKEYLSEGKFFVLFDVYGVESGGAGHEVGPRFITKGDKEYDDDNAHNSFNFANVPKDSSRYMGCVTDSNATLRVFCTNLKEDGTIRLRLKCYTKLKTEEPTFKAEKDTYIYDKGNHNELWLSYKKGQLIPSKFKNCKTEIKPLDSKENYCMCFNGKKWEYKSDLYSNHRQYCLWTEKGYELDISKKADVIAIIAKNVREATEQYIKDSQWGDCTITTPPAFKSIDEAKKYIASLQKMTMKGLMELL